MARVERDIDSFKWNRCLPALKLDGAWKYSCVGNKRVNNSFKLAWCWRSIVGAGRDMVDQLFQNVQVRYLKEL